MARGLNTIQLIGTLTQAPELRYTPGGLAILELNVAGSDHVIGDDGVARDLAWYHRVTSFGTIAESLANQLDRGHTRVRRRRYRVPQLGSPGWAAQKRHQHQRAAGRRDHVRCSQRRDDGG